MISKGTALILGLAYVLTLIGAAPAGGDKAPLVVATVCMDVKPDKEANLSKFLYYMEEASEPGLGSFMVSTDTRGAGLPVRHGGDHPRGQHQETRR